MTFHIRKRTARRRGNQFYLDRSPHRAADGGSLTYCGAEPTSYDIGWRDRAEPFAERIPCESCSTIREASK